MPTGILKKSSLHTSVTFRRTVTIFIPAFSGGKAASYGAIVGCVGAISGAPEQEYHILSGNRFPSILPSNVIVLHDVHNHLGQEAQ